MSSDEDKRIHTNSLVIEELGYVSASESNYVTVKLDRWHYYMDRAKLSMYKGAYRLEDGKISRREMP